MADSIIPSSPAPMQSAVSTADAPKIATATGAANPNPLTPATKQRHQLGKFVDYLFWALLAAFGIHLLMRDTGGPKTGQPAAAHSLAIVGQNGSQMVPGEHHGPMLMKTFASWCGACKRSAWLDDIASLGEDTNLQFIAVSVDEKMEDAAQAKESWPIHGAVYFDQSGDFSRDYQIKVLPTYILIDAQNRVQRVTSGLPGPLDLRAWKQAAQSKIDAQSTAD